MKNASEPRLYRELADWWTLLSAPADYAEEAGIFRDALISASPSRPKTVLELGSGGGNNASHLKQTFTMTLVDRSADMLRQSRKLNPECEHIEGDMRTVRIGRQFDAVFVHDAVCYLTTEADLRAAMDTVFIHLKAGGAALFAPDFTRESFQPSTEQGGEDGPERALRYLSWTWDPDPSDSTYLTDFAYLLRETDGSVRVESDRHVEGLFPRDTWLRLLAEAGFEPSALPFNHSELDSGRFELFLGRKAGAKP